MFKCPDCNADTKVVQTRSEPGKVTRRLKCKNCHKLFVTEEKFLKWTEESMRQMYQSYIPDRFEGTKWADNQLKKEHYVDVTKKNAHLTQFIQDQSKVIMSGIRSDKDVMIKMVTESKPMTPEDWMKFYEKYNEVVDTSDVGVIPPEV